MYAEISGFWEGFFLILIFLPLAFLWGFTLVDIFKRDDLKGWATALWVIAVILLPIFGMLMYFIVRPVTEQDVEMREAYAEEQEFMKASHAADKLQKLSELRDKGDITQEQFDKQKARLLKD